MLKHQPLIRVERKGSGKSERPAEFDPAASKGLWDDDMQRDLPKKWERHGDMIVFPRNSFTHNNWRFIGRELWRVVAESLNVARLGRKRIIDDEDDRTPHVDLLYGDHGWVEHVDDRGIRFIYDASKRVFNNKKLPEMQRISEWDCHGQTIVDMYAGLGYYSLRFLVCCGAKQVVSIDWSDDMCEALRRTAEANNVEDRMVVIEGDSRRVTPCQVADRVFLGLVPSCRAHWLTACKALKQEGGMLHIHEMIDINTKTPPKKVEPLDLFRAPPPRLQSVDEEGSSKENKPITGKSNSSPPKDMAEKGQVKRQLSRSQSIVEEIESRVLPTPKVLKDFEQGEWKSLAEPYKEFAMDCATNCTRFLNNIHFSDTMYCVTIVNITKYGGISKKSDHVALDLMCCKEDMAIEKMVARYLTLNHSST
ncbi:Methyltransferase [Trichostrongylus colubriformis]|uniref:tRNA(Phe) (4-demethylwyosine(37)-C(7)) aminocarboxypropyltransferase n=1 Tax=Trichostrongylus colubriformis TaxID=6319 RepID=A0AAN8EW41_TRICO